MAIAIHGTPVAAGTTDGLTDLTQNIVIDAGTDLVLFAATGVDASADRNPVCSSSLDGAMTLIAEVAGAPANSQNVAVFYKINPTVGTHTLTHGTDNAVAGDYIIGMAVCLSGVHQTTPFDAATVQTQGGSREDLTLTTTTET